MLRLGAYIRVSSDEQADGYSIEAQKHAITQWAAVNGYHIDRFFVDVGSGRNDNRPEFRKATRWLLNSSARGLVVHKIDRFARNLADLLFYMNMIQQSDKWLYSVSEPFVNDNSPLSKMLVSIMGALAQYYSDNLSLEIQKGQKQKARQGEYPGGKLPFGYTRNVSKEIVPHDVYGPLVTWAFQQYGTENYDLRTLNKLAQDEKNAPETMRYQTWSKIFKNRFYLGEFIWAKKVHQGSHKPLTDPDTFERVKALMSQRFTKKDSCRFWLLKGLVWSEPEGKKMYGALAKGRYPYYTAGKHRVRAENLEERLILRLSTVKGYNDLLPIKYRLAAKSVNNMGQIWQNLEYNHDRREFLQAVILPSGIHIAGNGISELQLQNGFTSY